MKHISELVGREIQVTVFFAHGSVSIKGEVGYLPITGCYEISPGQFFNEDVILDETTDPNHFYYWEHNQVQQVRV